MSNTNALSARDRIASLVDENSFVEIGATESQREARISTCRRNQYLQTVSSPAMVWIQVHPAYVYSQDASSLNGSIGEMHAKKIAHVYELACKDRGSCYRVDRLCRNASSGVYGCTCRFWSDLQDESKSFRCRSTDQCHLWQLRWRCCCYGCNE